ncbi:hypothetical protein JTB14_015169 [Gonioctena quinquepunctata]|nr:hypothetical protein JTB14_015169 [Gonioctena quinquepunctata]
MLGKCRKNNFQYNVAALNSQAHGKASTVADAATALRTAGVCLVDRNRFPDSSFAASMVISLQEDVTLPIQQQIFPISPRFVTPPRPVTSLYPETSACVTIPHPVKSAHQKKHSP